MKKYRSKAIAESSGLIAPSSDSPKDNTKKIRHKQS